MNFFPNSLRNHVLSSTLGKTEPPLLRTGTRTIYTAGRPPWYNEHGAQFKEAFVIGMSMETRMNRNLTS